MLVVLAPMLLEVNTTLSRCANGQPTSTSKFIPCANTWADEFLLTQHEAIRLLNNELRSTVESSRFDPGKYAWQGPVFSDWYMTFYYEALHHHHTMEEEVIFKWMKAKLGKEMPSVLESTRYDVTSALDETKAAAQNVIRLNDADNVDKLRVAAMSMIDQVKLHLDEVEQLYSQLLAKRFTAAEVNQKYQHLFDDRGIYGNKHYLPVVIRSMDKWASKNFAQQFKHNMPAAVRTMLEMVWMDHANIHNWAVIRSLRLPTPPNSAPKDAAHALLSNYVEVLMLAVGIGLVALLLTKLLRVVLSSDHVSTKTKSAKAAKQD
jgi:hypothetical protein